MGIGITSPQKLSNVSGSSNLTGTGTYGILNTSGASSQTGNYNINISINASQAIRTAAAFYAFSDKRIKNQIEPIDPLQALAVVSSLNPVLYNYIDTLFRKPIKSLGFIAQEVENLIPQAVGITQEFLPNILEEVSLKKERDGKIYFTSSKELPLYTEIKAFEPHGGMLILKVGNKLDQNTYELVGPVAPESDKIFLYGSQINDFRNLDYDKIFTYGIAAIKGLILKIEALERENRELREKVDEILIKNNFEAKK